MREKKVFTKLINGKKFISNQVMSLPRHNDKKPVFMTKWGQFLFTCFDSREKQLEWWIDTLKRKRKAGAAFEAYEVIYGDAPYSFFADIEVYCPVNADYLDRLQERIVTDVTNRCEELDEHCLVFSENHRN